MKVAAVIPTYNASAFIEGTLDSAFAQSRQPDEVIVADDASTDGTVEIVETLKLRKTVPVTLIRFPENSGGPAVPLNDAIRQSQCEWIATLDHDDRWRRTWLHSALKTAADTGAELVLGRVAVPNRAAQEQLDRRFEELFSQTIGGLLSHTLAYRELVPALSYGVTCSNMVFTRRIALEIPFDTNVKRCCDYRFLQQVSEKYNIAFSDTISCDWIASAESLYQHGSMHALDRDLLYVYDQFDPKLLTPALADLLRANRARLAHDLGYHASESGKTGEAFQYYRRSLADGGSMSRNVKGIVKAWLRKLRRRR
jgi:glycosyltransferase involved in cell wall biosynthesis